MYYCACFGIIWKKGSNVFDLCCGSGDLAFLLSQKVRLNGQVGFSLFPLLPFCIHLSFGNTFCYAFYTTILYSKYEINLSCCKKEFL